MHGRNSTAIRVTKALHDLLVSVLAAFGFDTSMAHFIA